MINRKHILNRIIRLTLWVAGIAGFIVLMVAAVNRHKTAIYTGVFVEIDSTVNLSFVNSLDVLKAFEGFAINEIDSMPLHQVDFSSFEAELKGNSYVKDVEVYFNSSGQVFVDISQKQPILRVINSRGVSFYLDEYGKLMPHSDKFTTRVPVATGYIDETDSSLINVLFEFTHHLMSKPFWAAQFEQVYVHESGELEWVPKLGKYTVLMGDATNLEDKLKRLSVFYGEVLKTTDEAEFKKINVKYKGQIICTKR